METGMPVEKPPTAAREIAEHDTEAFDEFVIKYQQRVLNLAYRLCGNEAASQDIAQEVFVRAYHSRAAFRGESDVFTWLYRITVNLANNYHRKRKWEKLFSFIAPELKDNWRIDETEQPDAVVEQMEERAILHKALLQLPEGQRTLLVLHRWEGRSYQEIAEITGLTLSAVESKMHRAKQRLGKILPDMLGHRG